MNTDGEIIKMRDEYNHRRRVIIQGLSDAGLDCFLLTVLFMHFLQLNARDSALKNFVSVSL